MVLWVAWVATMTSRSELDCIYVYGSFRQPGHLLYDVLRRWLGAGPGLAVTRALDLDGAVRPPIDPQDEGDRVSPGRRPPLPEGWSYVSWWDRQGDDRRGSHTGILARGTWSDAELVQAARRLAPWAIRVTLGPWAEPEERVCPTGHWHGRGGRCPTCGATDLLPMPTLRPA